MSLREADVCVIGGGISGLTAAHRLSRLGFKVVLLESAPSVGGSIKTVEVDGCLLELGPNTVMLKPQVASLLSELGLQPITPSGSAKERYLVHGTKSALIKMPSSPPSAITTPLLSLRGKLRILAEPFIKPTISEDESVYDFFTRRFGEEVASNLVNPALSGIWAADIKVLSLRSTLSALQSAEAETGSVIRHFLKNRTKSSGSAIISFENGLKTIPLALASNLGESIETKVVVERIIAESGAYRVLSSAGEYRARSILISTPAKSTAGIVTSLEPTLAEALTNVPHSSIGVLHLRVPTASFRKPPTGFGFLWKPAPGKGLLGAIYSSSLFPHVCSTGSILLTCFVGGAANPNLARVNEPVIQEQVKRELSILLKPTSEPEVLKATEWLEAIPNPAIGHFKTVEMAKKIEKKSDGMRFLSGWLEGPSVPARISHGEKIAREISEYLKMATLPSNLLKNRGNSM